LFSSLPESIVLDGSLDLMHFINFLMHLLEKIPGIIMKLLLKSRN
jgi:hypothetical protein